MTSSRQTGEPAKGGDEVDTFSQRARRLLLAFKRPRVARAAKRAFNKRVRKQRIEVCHED